MPCCVRRNWPSAVSIRGLRKPVVRNVWQARRSVLMVGMAGRGAGILSQYLFGSLTSVDRTDLIVVAVLAVLVLAAAIRYF